LFVTRLQKPLAQSLVAAQVLPSGHFAQVMPPQSMSVSPVLSCPSLHGSVLASEPASLLLLPSEASSPASPLLDPPLLDPPLLDPPLLDPPLLDPPLLLDSDGDPPLSSDSSEHPMTTTIPSAAMRAMFLRTRM
jgi:hypothetical protein